MSENAETSFENEFDDPSLEEEMRRERHNRIYHARHQRRLREASTKQWLLLALIDAAVFIVCLALAWSLYTMHAA